MVRSTRSLTQPARPRGIRGAVPCGRTDRGDIVMGWLSRLVIILAVVATIGYDGVQVGLAKVSIQDQASDAASAARDAWQTRHNVQYAYQAALTSAKGENAADVIPANEFTVTSTGVVTLTVTRPIHTLFAHYLPAATLRTASATSTAAPGN